MNTQPEALRLADFMIDCIEPLLFHALHCEVREVAAELRRLHEENQTLKQCLKQAQDAAVSLSKANIKALEFIEKCPAIYKAPEAAQALRQALAQPEQKPSKQFHEWACAEHQKILEESANSTTSVVESKVPTQTEQDTQTYFDGIPETKYIAPPKQQEREPVAWGLERYGVILDVICPEEHSEEPGNYTIPLYTAPPKREWVGLTDEDLASCLPGAARIPPGWKQTAQAIEAKLKEKNCG